MFIFARAVLKIVLPILLIAGLVIAYMQREGIYDWWRLRGYTPPATISKLAAQDTMTANARHIFYVNHPIIESNKYKFQQECTQTEQTIVLGCYKSSQQGIYIFDVTDKRLGGVEQVTAAHEMLHAAYDRLSKSDKQKVNGWLQDFYDHGLKDSRVIQTIKSYKKTEPKDVVNEMHSVFGSEVGKLPAKLEQYYKRYFSNRAKVVAYSDSYEGAFTSREKQIKTLYAQLQGLSKQINSLQPTLTKQKAALDADRSGIQTQADANAYNKRVHEYNAEVNRLNDLVSQYNAIRKEYNGLVIQQQQLINAIDTRATQPTQAQ